jgi:N-carbamoylputrescine amidase
MMRSHAIANGLFVCAPNRVGVEGNIEFWGGSFVSDPSGVLLAKAGHSEEEILLADCERGKLDVVRTHWPFLRDRRVDAYGDISKRFID